MKTRDLHALFNRNLKKTLICTAAFYNFVWILRKDDGFILVSSISFGVTEFAPILFQYCRSLFHPL